MSFKDAALKIRNYKCFGDEFQGFDSIMPVNVIVGRNNTGKSTLLELVQYAILPFDLAPLAHKGAQPEVLLEATLSVGEVRKVFRPGSHDNGFPRDVDHWTVGERCVGKKLAVLLPATQSNAARHFVRIEEDLPDYAKPFEGQLAQRLTNPFSSKVFRRLRAERSIQAEGDNDRGLQEDGSGATNIIQRFINKASLPSELVEQKLLEELNRIMEPDASFTDIVVQQRDNGQWEIYLEEKEKGRIALSQSGSGLQTALMLTILLYLVPYAEKRSLNDYVFALEEMENNAHPALQRRLFHYMRSIAGPDGPLFFITTHSSVVIDLLSTDPQAQLIHVTHDGCEAKTSRVEAYTECRGVLDDLDVRASDLLQANGVIWVEGPSDRLYFNRWIQLWTDNQLQEGVHYQCVFYGGRLLAHLSARSPDDQECGEEQALRILRVNRNALILIDSDRESAEEMLNDTKTRIIQEMDSIGAMRWITKGREVENYIPPATIASLYGRDSVRAVADYESFSSYLDEIQEGQASRFVSGKVLFAEKICRLLRKEDIESFSDLTQRLDEACERIKKWNGLSCL
jgi:putative ATP-dependent endonuclease of OLD family